MADKFWTRQLEYKGPDGKTYGPFRRDEIRTSNWIKRTWSLIFSKRFYWWRDRSATNSRTSGVCTKLTKNSSGSTTIRVQISKSGVDLVNITTFTSLRYRVNLLEKLEPLSLETQLCWSCPAFAELRNFKETPAGNCPMLAGWTADKEDLFEGRFFIPFLVRKVGKPSVCNIWKANQKQDDFLWDYDYYEKYGRRWCATVGKLNRCLNTSAPTFVPRGPHSPQAGPVQPTVRSQDEEKTREPAPHPPPVS